jgi:hypothetical protein
MQLVPISRLSHTSYTSLYSYRYNLEYASGDGGGGGSGGGGGGGGFAPGMTLVLDPPDPKQACDPGGVEWPVDPVVKAMTGVDRPLWWGCTSC